MPARWLAAPRAQPCHVKRAASGADGCWLLLTTRLCVSSARQNDVLDHGAHSKRAAIAPAMHVHA
jgi:hypothetical protein